MRKRLCEILTIAILTSLLYYDAVTMSEPKETMYLAEKITDEDDKPNMPSTMGELYMEETSKEEPEEEPEDWRTEEYREALQGEELLAWEWVVLPGRFDVIQFLGGEYIAVRKENGKYGILDGWGDFISSDEYDSIAACREQMVYVDNDGTKYDFVKEKYEAVPAYVYEDKARKRKSYGLAGTDGSWLLKPGYAYVGVPYGDYIRVVEYYYDKREVGVIRLKEKFTEGLSEYSVSDLEYLQRVVLYTDAQEDIDKIGQITSLEQLDLHLGSREDEGAIRNLDAIGKLENLKEIMISAPFMREELDTASLANLKKVRAVSLGSTEFDLSFLSGMEALEEVHTDRCTGVKDLSMFKGLRNLKTLYMEYVDVADLNYLKDAEQLEGIGIQATDDIYGFEALDNLHQLKSLYLDGYGENSERMDMAVLRNMKELKFVRIGRIPIDDIEALTSLEHLESITLVANGIEDMAVLFDIPNLKDLHIYGNESETVKRQAEEYADLLWHLEVADEIPYGL